MSFLLENDLYVNEIQVRVLQNDKDIIDVYSLFFNYLNEIKVNILFIKDIYVFFYRFKNFNQFILKCLVKNFDFRLIVVELLEVSLFLKYFFFFVYKNYLRID